MILLLRLYYPFVNKSLLYFIHYSGCHTLEKIVASAAKKFIVIADYRLNKFDENTI